MKPAISILVILVVGLVIFRLSDHKPVGKVGFGNWHGWKTQVDQTGKYALNPSQNPYMREAMFGLQNELPLRRIVTNDKGFPTY